MEMKSRVDFFCLLRSCKIFKKKMREDEIERFRERKEGERGGRKEMKKESS